MTAEEIIAALPYGESFRFVDRLSRIDEQGVEGFYRFRKDEYFYQGHFPDQPVTPGVMLIECMAQIGLVCLGVYLVEGSRLKVQGSKFKVEGSRFKVEGSRLKVESSKLRVESSGLEVESSVGFVFSESQVLFERPVWPGEELRVISRKKYWRMGKLKCEVEMYNAAGERVAHGNLSGMLIKDQRIKPSSHEAK